MAASHRPHGGQPRPGSFAALVREHGKVIKRLKYASLANKLSSEPKKIAPNSPIIPLLAHELGIAVETVREFAKGEPMSDSWVKKITNQLRNAEASGQSYYRRSRKPKGTSKDKANKGEVLASVAVKGGRGFSANHKGGFGNGRKPITGRPQGATTNKLRRGPLELREGVRTLINSINAAILNGDGAIPVPVADAHAFVTELLEVKGVRAVLLLDPNYNEVFD